MAKLRYMVVLLVAALLLSGCNMKSASELFCLPGRTGQSDDLQTAIREAMGKMEFSAPLNGSNQQSVQAADLNGDGQMEYMVYAKDDSEKPLHIFIFSGDGKHYSLLDTITCTGSAFDRVEYVQMDDALGCEIVVGRQVADQATRAVSVYALILDHMESLVTASYSRFITAPLDGSRRSQLLIFQNGTGGGGVVQLYGFQEGTVEQSAQISVSQPADNILQMVRGELLDGKPAVYVTSLAEDSEDIVTDVLVGRNGQLENLGTTGSLRAPRKEQLTAWDMDDDGILEFPDPIAVQGNLGEGQFVLRWYSISSDGSEQDKLYTYHNYAGGWYLELKPDLARRIDVASFGSSYEFRVWDPEFTQTQTLMNVYVLTGARREEQAVVNNRFVLLRGDSTVYAGELAVGSYSYGLTKTTLIGAFHLIREDWNTGG